MKKLILMTILSFLIIVASCTNQPKSKNIQQTALEKVSKFGRDSVGKYRTMSVLADDGRWHFWCQDLSSDYGIIIYYSAKDSLGTEDLVAYQAQYWPPNNPGDTTDVVWDLRQVNSTDSGEITKALAMIN